MSRSWLRYGIASLPPVLLALWLWLAGSYSPARDLLSIGVLTLIWLAVLFYPQPSSWRTRIGSPLTGFGWLLSCWVGLSLLDRICEPGPLPLRGSVAQPASIRPEAKHLRVGLALSGGGYRAALVHAGVLEELAARGVPVTNLAAVSGGSIIAAFIAQGGDPKDFVDAVKQGRFHFKRELLSAFNLPRWLLPFGSFSRRDVQASIVRRLILAGDPPLDRERPKGLFAMSDLSHAMTVGVTSTGYLTNGPTATRYFKIKDAMTIDGLGDQADIVAMSGAFPGAFPAFQTTAHFTLSKAPLSAADPGRAIPLTLVDGGVMDNLGIQALQSIDAEQRNPRNVALASTLFQPGEDWMLDAMIVSDGGQSLDTASDHMCLFKQVKRAIEVSEMATGILKPIDVSKTVAFSIASELSLSPDSVVTDTIYTSAANQRRAFFQSQRFSDQDLRSIVLLNTKQTEASRALDVYLASRVPGLDHSGANGASCDQNGPPQQNAPACAWRALTDVVLDDIDAAIAVFRRSATLDDSYSIEDADALVRLGRYFVLLKGNELDALLTKAGSTETIQSAP